MLTRIGLLLLALAFASQAILFGEQVLDPLLASLAQAAKMDGFVVFLRGAVAIVSIVVTTIFLVQALIGLFSAKTKYAPHSSIIWCGVVLIGSAATYGLWLKPYAENGLSIEQWFFTYPQSLLLWFIAAPALLVLLNFARELFTAIRQYEERARGEEDILTELHERLQILDKGISSLASQVNKSSEQTTASIYKNLAAIGTTIGAFAENEERKGVESERHLGGLSRMLREIQDQLKAMSMRLPPKLVESPGLGGGEHEEVPEALRQQQ